MKNLQPGQIVHVRSRKYIVEEVTPPPKPVNSPLVRLSCVEDDALGEPLEVMWDTGIDAQDAQVVDGANWQTIASRGFDEPRLFSAYLNPLRWNCVTSTDARLFQSPYRAGCNWFMPCRERREADDHLSPVAQIPQQR